MTEQEMLDRITGLEAQVSSLNATLDSLDQTLLEVAADDEAEFLAPWRITTDPASGDGAFRIYVPSGAARYEGGSVFVTGVSDGWYKTGVLARGTHNFWLKGSRYSAEVVGSDPDVDPAQGGWKLNIGSVTVS